MLPCEFPYQIPTAACLIFFINATWCVWLITNHVTNQSYPSKNRSTEQVSIKQPVIVYLITEPLKKQLNHFNIPLLSPLQSAESPRLPQSTDFSPNQVWSFFLFKILITHSTAIDPERERESRGWFNSMPSFPKFMYDNLIYKYRMRKCYL